jgi:hypothetical protein
MAPGHETRGGAADDLFIGPGMPHKVDDEQIEVLLVDSAHAARAMDLMG